MAENETKIDPKEFETAQREAADAKGIYIRKFETPFMYNDVSYKELTFNWGALKGRDAMAIEAELRSLGIVVLVPSMSVDYLIRMAARACTSKIGCDAFDQMSIFDFNKIRGAARSFLMKSDS